MSIETNCVITGVGVVSPAGCDRESYWETLAAGRGSLGRAPLFGAEHAAPLVGAIPGLAQHHGLAPRFTKRIDRFTIMAISAAKQALESAAISVTEQNRNAIGLLIGNCTGGWSFVEPQLYGLYGEQDFDAINGYVATAWFPTAPQGEISILLGLGGFSKTVAAENISAGYALRQAMTVLSDRQAGALLVGGVEAPLTPLVYNACLAHGLISPSERYRPFHQGADGALLGEAAGLLVVEREAHARERGAYIYARIRSVGFAGSLEGALRNCLDQAGLKRHEVDYVILDARGSEQADLEEYQALEAVFGPGAGPRISAPKSSYGHTLGASMALDLATACLALERQLVPPTVVGAGTLLRAPSGRHVYERAEPCALRNVIVNGRDNYGHAMSVLLSLA